MGRMMRYLYWGLTALLAILVACFAVSNRGTVDLEFWPLPLGLSVPLYLLVLTTLIVGAVVGRLLGWLANRPVRRERRRHAKRITELERECERLRAAAPAADHTVADRAAAKPLLPAV
jgi:uncharacterized integral membrane protein